MFRADVVFASGDLQRCRACGCRLVFRNPNNAIGVVVGGWSRSCSGQTDADCAESRWDQQ